MAEGDSKFSFAKLNFFSKLDARARVFVLFAGVIGMIFLIYIGSRFLGGGSAAIGPSRVASAPQGLQSVPGGQITPEYQRALMQANAQAAQQAQMTGGSAVPTMINTGQPNLPQAPSANCNIICSDQNVNVKNSIEDWVKQGKLTPDVASLLTNLADQNVSVSEYAAELDRLVREGKLTPEQARELLETYKKQHANRLLQDSANGMDAMIKAGKVPLDAANALLTAQKNNMSTSDYAAELQKLVREGKVSPETAQQLLAQYSQQRAREVVMQSIASLKQMTRNGEITAEVENALVVLENQMVPIDQYSAKLNEFLKSGKITPIAAEKIIKEYRMQKAAIGPTGSLNKMLQDAEAAAYGEVRDLLKEGKISQETGAKIVDMLQRNISLDDFKATIASLVNQGKLTPEIAKLKIADYVQVKGLRDLSQKLGVLQGNNATAAQYADELKRGVQAGGLTPEQAVQLMQEYQAAINRSAGATTTDTAGSTPEFAALQERLQQSSGTETAVPDAQFDEAQAKAAMQDAQDRQARIEALMNAMNGQAQQLVASWTAPTMAHRSGSAETTKAGAATKDATGKTILGKSSRDAAMSGAGAPPIIKAGSIVFAVLDTAVNSDYPDSPVMVTIVDGKYKGSKLLGKLVTTKGVSGQLDRVMLTFTLMNNDEWDRSRTVTAYAIDPDTARTVLASSVDYHYLQRFGAIMATSFVQGYANALQSSGGTTQITAFGNTTTNPALSPAQKLATAFGQIGTALGTVTQNYTNIPPTVRVDSGVGLGILFMADVTA
jgi:type IV secretory pathway VirB10-like protein